MKRTVICALLLSSAAWLHAQETTFKRFKFDIAAGYAIPSGSGTKGGIIFAMEPKYALNDQLTLGLRLEGAVTANITMDASGEEMTGSGKASGSYLLTADYYFNTNNFRPFVGAGAGLFRNAAVNVDSEDVQTGSNLGFAPRVGFELGHFRTAIEYNVAGKSGTLNNNYLGIKLGFFIGGGRLDY